MSLNLNVSIAPPLIKMHKNSTRKNYDYKYGQKNIFNKIEEHFKIIRVEKVYNPQLYGMYLLCKEELQTRNIFDVRELILYHATSSENAIEISKNNIDWRVTSRAKYGYGACFSTSPKYANKYSRAQGGIS
ncbi:poly [ADP-ribose] polymerase 11-like [Sipha flava]|uniref:Poly [ADP-ribose] polymerase 11-like n=1 Tax=Sipha flava TaxID=143950 RepID=A0A8B8FTG9_9HEMI|nr:poly [ADP-ribose] polymerase 11-like [Sipha flava]